jgi:predicted  nucleic acid-binding Zn-ribbon protein
MPTLSHMIGTAFSEATATAKEVADLKTELAELKASAAKQTDLTDATTRIKVLEDKPAFDPKALQDAIDTLVSNEKIDDEAVAALETALKAIDLRPRTLMLALKPWRMARRSLQRT